MIYFCPSVTLDEDLQIPFIEGKLGIFFTRRSYNPKNPLNQIAPHRFIDNHCFSKEEFTEKNFFKFLKRVDYMKNDIKWVVIPDVVGDALKTLEMFLYYNNKVKELGWRTAFVAQDGIEMLPIPWGEFDTMFVGGSTVFKYSAVVREIIKECNKRRVWCHIGRINSKKKFLYFKELGADSADGTTLKFGPAKNLPGILEWY